METIIIKEWILIVYLFFGSQQPVTQIGPFSSAALCEKAKRVHDATIFEIKFESKLKKKKQYSSKCVRSK